MHKNRCDTEVADVLRRCLGGVTWRSVVAHMGSPGGGAFHTVKVLPL